MQDLKVQDISAVPSLSHSSDGSRGLRYSEVLRRTGLRNTVYVVRQSLVDKWCIWCDALRSFHGHIRTQLAIGRPWVTVGSPRHQGTLNERSLCRRFYIEKLSATRRWVDSQDLELFLMGFDAGESWACRSRSECMDRQFVSASWLTPEIEGEMNNTLDMLKRQWYKSQYESAGHIDPSQSGELPH